MVGGITVELLHELVFIAFTSFLSSICLHACYYCEQISALF